MSTATATLFDSTLHTTNVWLRDVGEALGWDDRPRAYHALRAVLHALRDRLTVDEVATLGAQLPMLVRGFYYEGWHPHGKPLKDRKKEDFLAHIVRDYPDGSAAGIERVVRAVFGVIARHVTPGEREGVKRVLPPEIRELWP